MMPDSKEELASLAFKILTLQNGRMARVRVVGSTEQ
jgi:hypothetical protein